MADDPEKALLQEILKEIQICKRILRGEKVDDEPQG